MWAEAAAGAWLSQVLVQPPVPVAVAAVVSHSPPHPQQLQGLTHRLINCADSWHYPWCLQNPHHQPSAQLTSQVTALSPLAYHHPFHFRSICPPLAAISPELSLNYTAQIYNHFLANILSSFAFSPSTAPPQAWLSPISCPLHLCPEGPARRPPSCCVCAGL